MFILEELVAEMINKVNGSKPVVAITQGMESTLNDICVDTRLFFVF